jgi:hypothetical protein
MLIFKLIFEFQYNVTSRHITFLETDMTAYNCWNSIDLASVRHSVSLSFQTRCRRTFSGLSREVSVECGSFSSRKLQVIHAFDTVTHNKGDFYAQFSIML